MHRTLNFPLIRIAYIRIKRDPPVSVAFYLKPFCGICLSRFRKKVAMTCIRTVKSRAKSKRPQKAHLCHGHKGKNHCTMAGQREKITSNIHRTGQTERLVEHSFKFTYSTHCRPTEMKLCVRVTQHSRTCLQEPPA